MNARAHKAFMLNFFLDEGLGPQLAEAVRLVTSESTLSVLSTTTEEGGDNNIRSMPRYQDDQFKEQFRMQRSSFEVNKSEHNYLLLAITFPLTEAAPGRRQSYSRCGTSSANWARLAS